MKRSGPLKRKTWLKSGRPLGSGSGVARHTKLRTRKVSRRFASKRDPEYCAWIRTFPCAVKLVAACAGRVECAHVKSRGAGGEDRGNIAPLCVRHHREQHQIGVRSFDAKYHKSLATMAALLGALYPAFPEVCGASSAVGAPHG